MLYFMEEDKCTRNNKIKFMQMIRISKKTLKKNQQNIKENSETQKQIEKHMQKKL